MRPQFPTGPACKTPQLRPFSHPGLIFVLLPTWTILASVCGPTRADTGQLATGAEDPNAALDRALRAAEQGAAQSHPVNAGVPTSPAPPETQSARAEGEVTSGTARSTQASPPTPEDALDRALGQSGALEQSGARDQPGAGTATAPAIPGPPSPPPPASSSDIYSRQVGGANLRFIDLSLDALFAAGSSTESDEELQSLQGGGHDPRKRGFTIQNVELSLSGAVDPFFTAEAHIIYFLDPITGESQFELEEAFVTSQALPLELHSLGFQIEAGQSMTEFGRINPQHPHQWEWLDVPVVNARFFGPDGMRNPGFRVGWLSPLPWFSELHVGMQDANGETMASFYSSDELWEERPIGGRPFVEGDVHTLEDFAYLVRWDNGLDITDELSTLAGLSLVYGPNATGRHGYTRIYGADVVLKYRPLNNDHGWPFVIWQSEAMKRDYYADSYLGPDPADPTTTIALGSDMLRDWGFYTQVLWGFVRNWAAGVRFEYSGVEGSEDAETRNDPFRDDRLRVSPMVMYRPTEFSRLRLQYNYDYAQHLDERDAHSVWFGLEVLFGAHAAHSY